MSRRSTGLWTVNRTGKKEHATVHHFLLKELGGLLLAMGTLALRNENDLAGTRIEVDITATDKPVMRFQSIDVQVRMPAGLSAKDRTKLERAAEGCPIKHSFASDIPINVNYAYPD